MNQLNGVNEILISKPPIGYWKSRLFPFLIVVVIIIINVLLKEIEFIKDWDIYFFGLILIAFIPLYKGLIYSKIEIFYVALFKGNSLMVKWIKWGKIHDRSINLVDLEIKFHRNEWLRDTGYLQIKDRSMPTFQLIQRNSDNWSLMEMADFLKRIKQKFN